LKTADLGGWLFRHRTWLPLPIIAALLLIPAPARPSPFIVWSGGLIVAAGEWLRLAAVQHIGVISRTRSERLGPLVTSGPFNRVRNPLYIGNLALWIGVTISAGMLWLLPLIVPMLALEYHAIVRWEEQLLESRIGNAYREYVQRVPRWLPTFYAPRAARNTQSLSSEPSGPEFSWGETLFSERGTLIAIVAAYVLLWLKTRQSA
jgi:protein-S-isoprenylcysteine O-methyltransferase Ste14